MSAGDIATILGALALFITALDGMLQNRKIRSEVQKGLNVTTDTHTIVNSQRTEMAARVEQLEALITGAGDTLPNRREPPNGVERTEIIRQMKQLMRALEQQEKGTT